jgi:hypothetical protein
MSHPNDGDRDHETLDLFAELPPAPAQMSEAESVKGGGRQKKPVTELPYPADDITPPPPT